MTPVEKVARAIETYEFSLPGAGGLRGRLSVAPAAARALARIAITALMEPTEEMVAAVAVQTQPASAADYALALKAVKLLPASEHPDAGDVLAEIARDHRAMISKALE